MGNVVSQEMGTWRLGRLSSWWRGRQGVSVRWGDGGTWHLGFGWVVEREGGSHGSWLEGSGDACNHLSLTVFPAPRLVPLCTWPVHISIHTAPFPPPCPSHPSSYTSSSLAPHRPAPSLQPVQGRRGTMTSIPDLGSGLSCASCPITHLSNPLLSFSPALCHSCHSRCLLRTWRPCPGAWPPPGDAGGPGQDLQPLPSPPPARCGWLAMGVSRRRITTTTASRAIGSHLWELKKWLLFCCPPPPGLHRTGPWVPQPHSGTWPSPKWWWRGTQHCICTSPVTSRARNKRGGGHLLGPLLVLLCGISIADCSAVMGERGDVVMLYGLCTHATLAVLPTPSSWLLLPQQYVPS